MSAKTWIIDSGHGGMINNVYQTFPKKMYRFSQTEVFYEGVFNRRIKEMLIRRLEAKGIHVIDLCPTDLDVPLDIRANVANLYYAEYPNAVGISLHSNAGKGTGFEVYTSVGETESDAFAQLLAEEWKITLPDIKLRTDMADGDYDKEEHFYILRKTNCPFILPECLFYDNYEDYKKLINPDFQAIYVGLLVNFILKAELTL